jgi:uncharacterized Zn finger protein
MDRQQLQELIRSIRALMRCPNCGSSYHTSSIRVLEEADMACLIHLECSRCGMPVLATIVARTERIEQPKIITGIKEKDLDQRDKLSPLTVDDVLNMHQFLQNFDGDFESLLE